MRCGRRQSLLVLAGASLLACTAAPRAPRWAPSALGRPVDFVMALDLTRARGTWLEPILAKLAADASPRARAFASATQVDAFACVSGSSFDPLLAILHDAKSEGATDTQMQWTTVGDSVVVASASVKLANVSPADLATRLPVREGAIVEAWARGSALASAKPGAAQAAAPLVYRNLEDATAAIYVHPRLRAVVEARYDRDESAYDAETELLRFRKRLPAASELPFLGRLIDELDVRRAGRILHLEVALSARLSSLLEQLSGR